MSRHDPKSITVFLCGDVMLGRGIDQILPNPSDPGLFESYVRDAREYVRLAERKHGAISQPASYTYVWGDALSELEKRNPDLRIINLETSVTTSSDYWPGKAVHYRMHPANVQCLIAAGIDVCTLANNHILDWGYRGLEESLRTLKKSGIRFAGAGHDIDQASAPAIYALPSGQKVFIYAFGMPNSGVRSSWAATRNRAGVHYLSELTDAKMATIQTALSEARPGWDLSIASIHWGSNWDYQVPSYQSRIAHRLIDEAGFDVIYGHSSHHFKGIEIYRGKPILYGCGDFITDYEGIGGRHGYRGDLVLMYFIRFIPNQDRSMLLEAVPMETRQFSLHYASGENLKWIDATLNRECHLLGTEVVYQDGVIRFEKMA